MKTVTIPKSMNPYVVTINNSTSSYPAGKTVEVPDEVAEVIEDALELVPKPKKHSGSDKFKSVVFKSITEVTEDDLDGLASIGDYAFYNCTELASITIPKSVARIGNQALAYCSSLESIVIPDSVTYFGERVFYFSTGLKSVTLGNGITEIKANTFFQNPALTSLTIPASVTKIGSNAIACGSTTNKATISFLRTTPPTIESTTFNADNLAKIIVPKGCGGAYKAAANWSTFASYIEEAV